MSKKKILVISQYYYPENFRINDICEEWVKRGHDVTVITGIPNYPKGKFFKGYGYFRKRKEVVNGVKIKRLFITPRRNNKISLILNYYSFVISGWFWKLFTRHKADLVFIFEVSPMTQALPGIWYGKKRDIPVYLYVQDLWPENLQIVGGINNKIILNHFTKITMKIYKNSTKILTTSKSFKKSIEKRGIDKDKVMYWPQYAEDFYKPINSNYKRKENTLNIIFTGNIGTAQGLDILPEVASLLKKDNNQGVEFTIVGDGRYKDELLEKIISLDLKEYFNFMGMKKPEEIPEILSKTDVGFVSFSDNELFKMTIPAKLQSYMACGMPIIAVAFGETQSIIKDSNSGLVSDPGNIEHFYNNILKMQTMTNKEFKELSKNSIKYYKENFSKKKLLDVFENIISEVKNV